MKRIFKLLFLTSFIFIVLLSKSYAGLGAATVYKVTMKKAELCTGSTGVTNCDGAVIFGSGDSTMDIAAVDAGAVAATYGTAALLPLGETYTHLRVTISRLFTIKGTATTDTSSYTCNTLATASVNWPTSEAVDRFTYQPAIAKDATLAEMNAYLMNDSYKNCTAADCASSSDATADYSTPTYATYMETHSSDSHATHVLVYKLTTPYTVAIQPPVITMAFGTQNALQARKVGNNLCSIDAMEPIFTITIN